MSVRSESNVRNGGINNVIIIKYILKTSEAIQTVQINKDMFSISLLNECTISKQYCMSNLKLLGF